MTNPNKKSLAAALADFESVIIDGAECVNITTEDASAFYTDDEMSEFVQEVTDETRVVRFETEDLSPMQDGDCDDFLFREQDLFDGVMEGDVLVAKNLDGDECRLTFVSSSVVSLA